MSSPLGSSLSAMASGVEGVRRAGNLHEKAADAVQRSFHGPESATPLQSQGGEGTEAATLDLSTVSQDLAGAMTNMMKADAANQASVAVIKTADEMTQELVDIVG